MTEDFSMTTNLMIPEFSRPFNLDKVGQLAYTYEMTATPDELTALAKRFGVVSVDNLRAYFEIRRTSTQGEFEVDAHVVGDVVQSCVVTLQGVPEHLDFGYKVKLVEGAEGEDHQGQEDFQGDLEWLAESAKAGDLEFYQNNEVDFGELSAQYLSLELNPYPRAEQPTSFAAFSSTEGRSDPFATLGELKASSGA
jgi:hypothetical protein